MSIRNKDYCVVLFLLTMGHCVTFYLYRMADEKTALEEQEKMALNLEPNNHEPLDSAATTPGNDSIFDNSTVKFVNGGKDNEAMIDMEDGDAKKSGSDEFVGLRKEELMKFASDPYWVKIRIILLAIFGLAWVAMLVAAIVIIVIAPKCPPRPHLDWWQKAVMYEISPTSFLDKKDNNEPMPGRGDIEGAY